jgi:hypothetical protein
MHRELKREPTRPPALRLRGQQRRKATQPFLSHALADQYVGFEAIGDGGTRTLLGRIDQRTATITGV